MVDVLGVGELNPDLILGPMSGDGPRLGSEQEAEGLTLTLGSSTAICLVRLSRLGLRVKMVAKVGRDDYGGFCLTRLEEEGVDTRDVLVDPALATGLTVSLTYASDRLLATFPGSMRALTADEVPSAALAGARHLHVGSFYLQHALQPGLATLFERARRGGARTSLDPGWAPDGRWALPTLLAALPHTDVFMPNRKELAAVSSQPDIEAGAHWALDLGVRQVVVKDGPRGATLFRGEAPPLSHPGYEVAVRDTTGAGDSFDAGFLYGFLTGLPPGASLKLGNACGALAAGALGGTGGFRSLAEVRSFLEARGEQSPELP
jgi:sugar/nucleoside kinase (ribokinase family)